MANVFNTNRDIKERYDLKGSTHGRSTTVKEGEVHNPKIALKDLDWLKKKLKVNLIPQQINLLKQQLKADA
jgi:1-phosphatidylinositol-4-phosphate 5-kinase